MAIICLLEEDLIHLIETDVTDDLLRVPPHYLSIDGQEKGLRPLVGVDLDYLVLLYLRGVID